MKNFIRKIYYYSQIIPIIKNIRNWYLVFLVYILPNHPYKLVLNSGVSFRINHHIDALTIKEIFIEGEYASGSKHPKIIVDIGANIGTFSTLMSKTYPRSQIYSYEPDPRTYDLLKRNIDDNNCHNVSLFKLGVSNKSGTVTFYSSPITGTSSLNRSSNQGQVRPIKIKLTTLDQIVKLNKISQIDILKIDAEGVEFDILLNCPRQILSVTKEIFLEYHDKLTNHTHPELIKKLQKSGYYITVRPHHFEDHIGVIHACRVT